MSNHNYADCQDQACALCDAYAQGKDRALFECAVAACHIRTTPECECSPCTALRYAIHTMGQGTPGPRVPAPEVGRCCDCERNRMLIAIDDVGVCRECWAGWA